MPIIVAEIACIPWREIFVFAVRTMLTLTATERGASDCARVTVRAAWIAYRHRY